MSHPAVSSPAQMVSLPSGLRAKRRMTGARMMAPSAA